MRASDYDATDLSQRDRGPDVDLKKVCGVAGCTDSNAFEFGGRSGYCQRHAKNRERHGSPTARKCYGCKERFDNRDSAECVTHRFLCSKCYTDKILKCKKCGAARVLYDYGAKCPKCAVRLAYKRRGFCKKHNEKKVKVKPEHKIRWCPTCFAERRSIASKCEHGPRDPLPGGGYQKCKKCRSKWVARFNRSDKGMSYREGYKGRRNELSRKKNMVRLAVNLIRVAKLFDETSEAMAIRSVAAMLKRKGITK